MRRGRPPYPGLLTPREQQVLSLLREGLSNPEIAQRLGISRFGVKYHVSEILSKLGVATREEAAAWQGDLRRHRGLLVWPHWKTVASVGAGAALAGLALVLSILLLRDTPEALGRLAYVQDGNLWVRDLPDGRARQLTTAGNAHSPTWSPSGEWLLVNLEPEPTVMRGDGSARRMVPGCGEWSPSADELLCSNDAGLFIERADGSMRRSLNVEGTRSFVGASWGQDGAHIAFTVDGPLERTDDGGAARLSKADGSFFSRTSALWIVETDGSNPRLLFENDAFLDRGGQVIVIGWMGNTVLFVLNPHFASSALNDGLPLYSIPALGGEAIDTGAFLLLGRHLRGDATGSTPILTVGGGRMLWSNKQIGYMDAVGELHVLTDGELAAFAPAWSPDGRHVAYVSAPDLGLVDNYEGLTSVQQRRIWLMDRDGANKRPLTGAVHREERPLWSADGASILHVRVIEDEAALWFVPVSGGVPEKVAVVSSHPSPSPSTASPAPWFGYYGQTDWSSFFDWWQP